LAQPGVIGTSGMLGSWSSQNRMNLFSATILFLPLLQAEEDHHGCLVKENSQVSAGSYGKWLETTRSSNVEDCSEACADRDDCDTFSVDNNKICRLYRKGTIYTPGSISSTAGFCPKGKGSYTNNGIDVRPAYSPLKCSTEHPDQVCQFPFLLNGEVKWDCVEATAADGWTRPAKVCNVEQSMQMQKFQDLSRFVECGECASSVQEDGLVYFQGF